MGLNEVNKKSHTIGLQLNIYSRRRVYSPGAIFTRSVTTPYSVIFLNKSSIFE